MLEAGGSTGGWPGTEHAWAPPFHSPGCKRSWPRHSGWSHFPPCGHRWDSLGGRSWSLRVKNCGVSGTTSVKGVCLKDQFKAHKYELKVGKVWIQTGHGQGVRVTRPTPLISTLILKKMSLTLACLDETRKVSAEMKISWASLWGAWQMSSLGVDWGHQNRDKTHSVPVKMRLLHQKSGL